MEKVATLLKNSSSDPFSILWNSGLGAAFGILQYLVLTIKKLQNICKSIKRIINLFENTKCHSYSGITLGEQQKFGEGSLRSVSENNRGAMHRCSRLTGSVEFAGK